MGGVQLALQPRLQAIADLVPQGTRLVDVGTDHGYLPIYLLQRGRIDSAIATDIGAAPLAHGQRTAAAFGMEERVVFRLCDGLQDVSPDEVDTVVIAGMGGETIAAILDAVPWSREKALLLQPMSRVEFLRPWLADNEYYITTETLVRDKGHLYPILQVCGGQMPPLAPGQNYYGYAENSPLFAEYLSGWIRRIGHAVTGLRHSEDSSERLHMLEKDLAALREKEGTL